MNTDIQTPQKEKDPIEELSWWQILLIPAIVLAVLYGVRYALEWVGLPADNDILIAYLKDWIQVYGFSVSIIGAFLEGLLLVGWYFPGSFIIFLTVILAGSIPNTIVAVLVVSLGMYSAYIVNFLLGKYGWHTLLSRFGLDAAIDDAKQRLEKYGTRAIFFSFWNPGLASFTATAAGVIRYSFVRFLIEAALAILVWNTFWGIIAYNIGEQVLKMLFNWYFIGAILFGWALLKIYELWKEGKLFK
jgi:membrane protein DedA with SNARE-associated domain